MSARSREAFWRRLFGLGLLLCLSAEIVRRLVAHPQSSHAWIIGYGIATAAALFLVSLYGLRRRMIRMSSRIAFGSTRSWLLVHLYGGGLFLLLMGLHSGWRVPRGLVDILLWSASLFTVVSGLVGLGLQKWIPKVLGSSLATEVPYERIPELVEDLAERAEKLVAECSESVQRLYARRLAGDFAVPTRSLRFFVDPSGVTSSVREIEFLEERVAAADRPQVELLGEMLKAKREIDAHYTLQLPLRVWLLVHIPVSVIVWALAAVHVFSVLTY